MMLEFALGVAVGGAFVAVVVGLLLRQVLGPPRDEYYDERWDV
jgi:hypothetical protein